MKAISEKLQAQAASSEGIVRVLREVKPNLLTKTSNSSSTSNFLCFGVHCNQMGGHCLLKVQKTKNSGLLGNFEKLRRKMIEILNFVFQQDIAPTHKSNIVINFIEEKGELLKSSAFDANPQKTDKSIGNFGRKIVGN